MPAMMSGAVRLSRSLLPWTSLGQSANRSPAVARLVRPVPLDRRAHGAVEHQDALRSAR